MKTAFQQKAVNQKTSIFSVAECLNCIPIHGRSNVIKSAAPSGVVISPTRRNPDFS